MGEGKTTASLEQEFITEFQSRVAWYVEAKNLPALEGTRLLLKNLKTHMDEVRGSNSLSLEQELTLQLVSHIVEREEIKEQERKEQEK